MALRIDRRAVNRAALLIALMSIAPSPALAQEPPAPDTVPAEDIMGVEWVAEEIAGAEIVEGRASTLVLLEDGTANGMAACNRFFAAVTLDEGAISFSDIGGTLMACEEPVMAQERAYLEALSLAASFRIEDGRLLLLDAEGASLVAFSASA